ncbi:MAG: prepilin-type N-terminal cleavage/methylation domain-containing protein [Synechococcaceae cyanobacterium]|nr:prepilin-type N-terminal cleavage/methylation domain-containing protein [Synechococcaceae cyanobacterium]
MARPPWPALRRAAAARMPAFTLVELLMVVVILGILSAIVVPLYRQRLRQERFYKASRELVIWLEEQRRLAVQQAAPCAITIHTGSASLDASAAETGISGDVCTGGQTRTPVLQLRTLEPDLESLTLAIGGTPAFSNPLVFSFRGSTSTPLELRLSLDGRSRCVRVTRPLALIRAGEIPAGQTVCRYQAL